MKRFLYCLISCCILSACTHSLEPDAELSSDISGKYGITGVPIGPPGPPIVNPSGEIQLGKKLENHYTVAAMKTAFYNVVTSAQTGPSGPQGPMGPGGVY